MFPSADLALVRRIEAANAALVTEFGQVGSGCAGEPIASGAAVYAGAESPMTYAVGIGLDGPVTSEEFDRLESFFRDRGAPCIIDLPAPAHPSILEFVRARPYRFQLLYTLVNLRRD